MKKGHVIKNKIARLVANLNKENKTVTQVMSDFHFGLRIEDGDLSNPAEIVRATSIIDVLRNDNLITEDEMIDLKTNIIEKLEKYEFTLKEDEPAAPSLYDMKFKEILIERSGKATARILQPGD